MADDDLSPMDRLRQEAEQQKQPTTPEKEVVQDKEVSQDFKALASEIGQSMNEQGVEQKDMTRADEMGQHASQASPGVEEKSLMAQHYNQDPPEAVQQVEAQRDNQPSSLQDKIKQETPEPPKEQEQTQEPER